jgi:hypothetical protein
MTASPVEPDEESILAGPNLPSRHWMPAAWIPAFAGMTGEGRAAMSGEGRASVCLYLEAVPLKRTWYDG